MPRIVHIITGLGAGGAETALYRLITNSGGGEYTHSVVSLTEGGSMHASFRDAGIDVVSLNFKRSPLSAFFRLVILLRKTRPDIVQTWMYHADILGGLAARMAGIWNVIWGIRTTGLPAGSHALRILRRIGALLSSFIPHTIVCVAEASRSAHVLAGYDARRMVVIHNGFETAAVSLSPGDRRAMRAQCGCENEHVLIGISGRFDADKDHLNFVRAAGELAAAHPNVRFLMMGDGVDADNAELAGWINATGFADRFALLGQRSDVTVCMTAMDVFCLSSRNEGFPNVVGEAMALGIPCVVTDVGDAALLVGDTGIVVPKEDSSALATALATFVAQTAESRRTLAVRAIARIEQQFTMQRVREKLEMVYQHVQEGGNHVRYKRLFRRQSRPR
ncbi:MAG: glycosyl transferase group 1-like protein [Herminiimonas sp.]|nr:glycosyl transferase group 1-like protein [Herminiimonas sp.]